MKKIETRINDKSKSLLDALREDGHFLPAYCGGRGTCGKCKVRFLTEAPKADDRQQSCLSNQEIEDGWRLACLTYVDGSCVMEVPDYREDEIAAADSFAADELAAIGSPDVNANRAAADSTGHGHSFEGTALAIDLGTTTIAASLVNISDGAAFHTVTCLNHQRSYGADVLSRIDAANKGEGRRLQGLVMDDLSYLCRQLGIAEQIQDVNIPVIISGNTTMEHLLQGLSCQGLGLYPFTPVDISLHSYGNMTILPGISTYVGADIVSGILACDIDRREQVSILVDLGTNGEMLIGNKDRILATSTAAGPAFEGGNISCGLAGIPGAIDTVHIEDGQTRITTIAGSAPVGICGTGVLETVYELVKEEIVDETGLLDDAWFEEGYPLAEGITFSAKDIREVQLAKSAIRAGIEILLVSYGITYDQVDRLYLAGGFGQKINCHKAVGIGMLPEELADRIVAVGNSSMNGACMFAANPELADRFHHITEISEEINLSNHKLFNDLYLEHMFFYL
ncbi:MAG: DUF4445 domain-containing protein [Eubacterium sp.]|nr:DUF4445 domain-containing protein [Eubacterium sp.]